MIPGSMTVVLLIILSVVQANQKGIHDCVLLVLLLPTKIKVRINSFLQASSTSHCHHQVLHVQQTPQPRCGPEAGHVIHHPDALWWWELSLWWRVWGRGCCGGECGGGGVGLERGCCEGLKRAPSGWSIFDSLT